ncbi:hypothetical protein N9V65_05120, partial [Flavobacteriales bacterium]|nr:hypothetical protein [Flavobacteriales bacterium]
SESYTWQVNGVTYFEDNYTDEAVLINAASNGTCDLIVTIDLTFEEPSSSTETIEKCNEFTWIDGITYTESTNTPTFVLQNSVGCDSVITLDLTINYSDTTSSNITSCNEYTWENSTYTESGSYTKTLSNQNSCDSIHTLNLTINYSGTVFVDTTVCDVFIWEGSEYTESGTITRTLTNLNGCDSIHTYNLTIIESSFGTDIQESCDEFTWIDGITYTESTNSVTDTLVNALGCDSVVTLDLTINYSDSTFSDITVCNAFVWDGITYTASGEYTNGYTNAIGCDSTHTFNLIVNYSDTIFVESNVCDVFIWEDSVYTESGTITRTLTNLNGCDSVVNIDLTILNSSDSTFIDSTVCNELLWEDSVYTESGTITRTLTNSVGCDSVVILNLTVNGYNSSTSSATVCDPFTWNGSLYNESGTFTFDTIGQFGCDSVATLILTILEKSYSTDTRFECDTLIWLDGITYTASNNTATHTIDNGNSNGCDSIITLNLTIHEVDSISTDTTVCNEFVWGDSTYIESNTITRTLVASNGCDSIHTIILTVNKTTFGIDTQVHCEEYEWIDGITYTESNDTAATFTFEGGNVNGCDSIVTLDLTILESTSSLLYSVIACDSYLWNDSLYTESGLKVFNTTNSVGCDSIARVYLTINESTSGIDSQIHCDAFTWIDGITYTESNDTATFTILGGNSNGCDSTVTLDLTINYSDSTSSDITV